MDEKKQIEEMVKTAEKAAESYSLDDCPHDRCPYLNSEISCEGCAIIEAFRKENYRKQSEGEWETIPDYQPNKLIAYRHICSVCKVTYKDIRPHGHKFCHECGAKMKGGE